MALNANGLYRFVGLKFADDSPTANTNECSEDALQTVVK